MTWKLFLDDLRPPPDGSWVVARSVPAALEHIDVYGLPIAMSLDHDLGTDVDTPVLVHELIKRSLDGQYADWQLLAINYRVHSANIIGYENLMGLWLNYTKHLANMRDLKRRHQCDS
jgi:hypothetical protein